MIENIEVEQLEISEEVELQSQEELQIEMEERLQVFGSRLRKLVSEQSQRKAPIEERWLNNLRQYHGKYTAAEIESLKGGNSAEVFVNITRNKSNAAEARLQDMLFPTDDRNWSINSTPVPNIEEFKQDPNNADEASRLVREAEARAELMQTEIDDQLTEAKYQAKCRDMMHESVVLGDGIIKGPIIVGKSKKKWVEDEYGNSVLTFEEDLKPTVDSVSVWNFYPDMSATILADCEFIFEKHSFTKKQLREFARLPGVLQGHIRNIVKSGKSRTLVQDRTADIRSITGIDTYVSGNRYELWEYHGPISKQEYIDAVSMVEEKDYVTQDEIDVLDDEFEAIVFFSDTYVVKVAINPMDSEERPYSGLCWEKDDSSPFGFGVPYLMSSAQKVLNSSWRMMLDNSGQAVTDQIIINDTIVEPMDGNWVMGPKKIWRMTDAAASVRDAFAVFETRNHQAEYANIIQMARQFADEETNMPLIAQGEQASHVTKTSSGMSMLMNSANIVLRRAVKNWDDDVTNTMIPRFYDWNMQYNSKKEIKGDYSVEARGSSALLVREKQQESLMLFANLSATNPELASRRDWEGLDKEIAKSLEVPYNNITLSDDEIKERRKAQEQQPQQQDPMIAIKQQEVEIKASESQQMIAIKQQEMQMNYDIKVAELALKENLTMAQMQQKLDSDLLKDKTTRDKVAAELALKNTETNLKAQNLAQGHDTYG